jgi:hypothetical protein
VVAIGAELQGTPRKRTSHVRSKPNEHPYATEFISDHRSSSPFVADGHGRVVPWRFQKTFQKLSRTWPIWPPCTCWGSHGSLLSNT